MIPREGEEYQALRATIRERGTARIWIFVVGLAVWAMLTVAMTSVGVIPMTALVTLLVLAATFEAVFALHVGAERIGRYLQVFMEDRWEATAMAFGPPMAGTSSDPLFVLCFGLATFLNFGAVLTASPVPVELAVIGSGHALFLMRLLYARHAAGRQRAADLERYTFLHSRR